MPNVREHKNFIAENAMAVIKGGTRDAALTAKVDQPNTNYLKVEWSRVAYPILPNHAQ